MLFVFNYVYWCPKLFPYHMMLVSFNSLTQRVERQLLTLPENVSWPLRLLVGFVLHSI